MLFEDISYLNNKDRLYTKEQQTDMESQMDVYFHCVIKGYHYKTKETEWESTKDMTRTQIANCLGEHVIIDVMYAHPIGYNYDIQGKKMWLQ